MLPIMHNRKMIVEKTKVLASKSGTTVAELVFTDTNSLIASLAPRPHLFGGSIVKWSFQQQMPHREYELQLHNNMMRGRIATVRNLLAVGSEKSIALHHLDSGEVIREIPGPCAGVRFGHDGSYMAVAQLETPISIYDLSLRLIHRFGDNSEYAHCMDSSPYSRTITFATQSRPYKSRRSIKWTPADVYVYDLKSGTQITLPHPSGVGALVFVSEADYLLSAGFDGILRLWDTRTHEVITTAKILRADYNPLLCSDAHGTLIVVATTKTEIALLDALFRIRGTFNVRECGLITSMAMSASGNTFATGDATGHITLFEIV